MASLSPIGDRQVSIVAGITRMSPFDFTNYPISHSLLMSFVWAAVFGGGYYLIRRYSAGPWTLTLAVLSHRFLEANHREAIAAMDFFTVPTILRRPLLLLCHQP
jgi:hypothetical protein